MSMNIGLPQLQEARERRARRERNLTERARESDTAAFRSHQAEANNPPVPQLPPVQAGQDNEQDEDDGFISAADRAADSPYDSIIGNDNDDAANGNDGTDYHFEANGGELDYAAESYNVNDRIMHHLGGMLITSRTRLAVEIAVAIHALTVVVSEETTNAATRNEKLLKEYKDCLQAFDPSSFEPGLKDKMLNKLYNAQQVLTGARLYAKSTDWRSEIRNSYMNRLPNNLSTLASGTGLRDAYNKFILNRYKEAHPEAVDGMDDDDIEVEPEFWFKHTSIRCLLAAMVHRKNKEIANDCSSQTAGATRNAIRTNARAALNAARAEESSAAREADPEFRMFKRIKLNKTQMEIISSQSDIISLQLKLFQENKETFVAKNGEYAFNEKITSLLEKLPDPVVDLMADHEESQQQDNSP